MKCPKCAEDLVRIRFSIPTTYVHRIDNPECNIYSITVQYKEVKK